MGRTFFSDSQAIKALAVKDLNRAMLRARSGLCPTRWRVLENDVGVDLQPVFLGQVAQGIEEYLDGVGPGEYGDPVQHRAGDEMGLVRCGELVAASAHGLGPWEGLTVA